MVTLLGDGPSDRCLLEPLRWRIRAWLQAGNREAEFTTQFANGPGVVEVKIGRALESFPADLLVVHRDAEGQPADDRRREIEAGADACPEAPPIVCMVPVRMTEAWLLFDERAIRLAADNPNGTVPLSLPRAADGDTDPKTTLSRALEQAAEKRGRRLKRFKERLSRRRLRVAEHVADYEPLRQANPDFARFCDDLDAALERWWEEESESPDQ
ncbi:MAG: DUF4276 family protein [Deltaproteobacteria bacterium]|nr:DUF4276 family protein [Deltaproteobacteria bacterium]